MNSDEGKQVETPLYELQITESFEEFLNQFEGRVFYLAMHLTTNLDDAEVVLSDAFVSVYSKLKDLTSISDIVSTLYRSAIRSAKSRYSKSIETEQPDIFPELAAKLKKEEPLTASEKRLLIETRINSLPFNHRAVFILSDVLSLSTEEIASIMLLTTSEVKSRLKRARYALARGTEEVNEETLRSLIGSGSLAAFVSQNTII